MREIKFRIWNTRTKIMDYNPTYNSLSENINDSFGYDNKIIEMQYTGLKDKNGKEIYESDIVYIAGYGNMKIKFPFIDLYEAGYEKDIGAILGNIYENNNLIK